MTMTLISRNLYSHLLDFPIFKKTFRVNHNYAIDHQLLDIRLVFKKKMIRGLKGIKLFLRMTRDF